MRARASRDAHSHLPFYLAVSTRFVSAAVVFLLLQAAGSPSLAATQDGSIFAAGAPPRLGEYGLIVSPWVAEVDGRARVVGRITVRGRSAEPETVNLGGQRCGSHPFNVSIQVTGVPSGPAYEGVGPSSPQTPEGIGRVVVMRRPGFVSRGEIPIFAGGDRPPPGPSYYWIRAVEGSVVSGSLRHVAPADFGVQGDPLPPGALVTLHWDFRIAPVDRILAEEIENPRQLLPMDRVRAIQALNRCEASVELELPADASVVSTDASRTATDPEDGHTPVGAPESGPVEVGSGAGREIGLLEVMEEAERLPAGEGGLLVGFYEWFRDHIRLPRLFSAGCVAVGFGDHVRRNGLSLREELGTTSGADRVPTRVYAECFSESEVRVWVRERVEGSMQRDRVDPGCVANGLLPRLREELERSLQGTPPVLLVPLPNQWVNRWYTDAVVACIGGGAGR